MQDTIVAISTPPGQGAIAIVRMSGPKSISIADEVFKGKLLREQPSHTVHFGSIMDEEGGVLDEVLVSIFKGPHSFTGQDSVEIGCHGSPYVQQKILERLVKAGARPAAGGEFSMRAFLNGKMDLSQTEAVADLIAADSEAAHRIAVKQMRGGVSNELKVIREQLIHFASLIELENDFSEENVEFADKGQLLGLIQEINTKIEKLMESFRWGNALKSGISTVIAGLPNAGKSTLLNGMLDEERAIVSEIAGTTRDYLEEVMTIQGIKFRLVDTAGIRQASNAIERIGVGKTMEKVQQADLLVYLYDSTMMSAESAKDLASNLATHDIPILVLANKADKPNSKPCEESATLLKISSKAADDIERVKTALVSLAKEFYGGNQTESDTIISNARHHHALSQAHESLALAASNIQSGVSGDFVALDIRSATQALGSITGDISSDDLLDNIFYRFCIGK